MNSFLSLDGPPARSMFRPDTKSLRRLLLTTAVTWAIGPAGSLAAQFAAPTTYFGGFGTAPVALAGGALTAGSNPDLVAANAGLTVPSYFEWWKNNGGPCPLFGSPPFVPASTAPVVFGDLGAIDIAVAEIDSGGLEEVVTLEATGFGTGYQLRVRTGVGANGVNPAPIVTSPSAVQMLVEDFNGDGDNDVLVLDSGGNVLVHVNAGGSILPAGPVLALVPGVGPTVRFAVGSFNGDHRPDLVVLWGGAGLIPAQAHVLLNTTPDGGVVSFAAPSISAFPVGTQWPLGPGAVDITTGDFDGDGCDDFVVGGGLLAGGPSLWMCRVDRTAAGWPALPLALPVPVAQANLLPFGVRPVALASGDFDLDGRLDVAYTASDNSLHVRRGLGDGSLSAVEQVLAGWGGLDIDALDLDGDGDLDLATCDATVTCVYCNLAPVGRCHHVLRAGIDDSYTLAGLPLVETTCPRPALGVVPRTFDVVLAASALGHTFENLPDHIVAARLYLGLCPDVALGNLTDTLQLDFGPNGPELGFALTAPVPFHTVAGVLCLDLAQLPGCLNLLPRLSKAHRLDVTIGTDTKVDYLRLELTTACPDHDLALKYDPALGVDSYHHTPLVAGSTTTFSIDASPSHASGIAVIGMGPAVGCVSFESLCLFITDVPIVMLLDLAGQATVSVPIPGSMPPCLHLHTQALAFDATFTWAAAKWSDTISDYSHQ